MIDKWLTSNEIAKLLSIDPRSANRKAALDNWSYKKYTVRGGQERRYHIANLPEDIQTAYAASIKVSLADLQSQLKPDSKPDKKIDIPGIPAEAQKPEK